LIFDKHGAGKNRIRTGTIKQTPQRVSPDHYRSLHNLTGGIAPK
jgi:hypothetical protein